MPVWLLVLIQTSLLMIVQVVVIKFALIPFGDIITWKFKENCPSEYIKNTIKKLCEKCDSDCETCSANGSKYCLTCFSGGKKPYHDSSVIGENGMCVSKCIALNPYADYTTKNCYNTCPDNLWATIIRTNQ